MANNTDAQDQPALTRIVGKKVRSYGQFMWDKQSYKSMETHNPIPIRRHNIMQNQTLFRIVAIFVTFVTVCYVLSWRNTGSNN